MRKIFLAGTSLILFLFLGSPQLFGMCATTVNWYNLNDCTNPALRLDGPADDVNNQNIDIQGTNVILGPLHVNATTCDIVVTITGGDATLQACDETARLYLYAATGRTITFSLTDNLTFEGSTGNDLFLVTVTGGGQVIFEIEGGQSVTLQASGTNTEGTLLAIQMNVVEQPTLLFRRFQFGSDINADVNININAGSCVSFVGSSSAAVGTVLFDPSNIGSGQMLLNLADDSCFLVQGQFINPVVDPTVTDIIPTVTSGASARFVVENTNIALGAASFLRVINANNTCTPLQFDPFCNGEFLATGSQTGFILGPAGIIIVNDMSYLDYIGTTTNLCCTFTRLDECGNIVTDERLRNGSALIVDGIDGTSTSTIQLNGTSAVYFRSGVDKCGDVSPSFTIDPNLRSDCQGNIVLDVEGILAVIGDPAGDNGINILSLEVTPTGCPVLVGGTETGFPARTFARDAQGNYVQYNSAAFLINNRMNLYNTSLIHTDEAHNVYQQGNLGRSDLNSEPTYIGGDSYLFPCHAGMARPTIAFYNAQFQVNTDVASTGVDFLVGNTLLGNDSQFIFYQNGFCIDRGYGRNWIMGTGLCFDNCGTTTDTSSHLNIFQETEQAVTSSHILRLLVAPNSDCITEGITSTAAIATQYSVQTLYMNNETNISIGTQLGTVPFSLVTTPSLLIEGVYFSFETKGGAWAYPEASGTTGQGGIFVDQNGTFAVLNNRIVNISAMVTKSGNGIISLPQQNVHFRNRVGITKWKPNLNDPAQRILVAANEDLSDFTMDWGDIIKECPITTTFGFVPYDLPETPSICNCPDVTDANLRGLPVIQGSVQQMQIKRSRIGNQAHLLVDGGYIRELVLLSGFNPAEAAVGFIVVQNDAEVGIGSEHRNLDSLEASIMLGVNGVMLVANGNGSFVLNEDVEINNVCPILTGTSFGLTEPQTLTIYSTTPKTLRIKSTGSLDLSQFDSTNKILKFAGQVRLVAEPGARIVLNGGIVQFTDFTTIQLDPVLAQDLPVGTSVSSTDDFRVKLSGLGSIVMQDGSYMLIPQDAYFGVETLPSCTTTTNIIWTLQDQAKIFVGNDEFLGGTFQVGDTSTTTTTQSVNLQLILDGQGTQFVVGSQGFFGLGTGIVDKASAIPDEWLIGCLDNVNSVTINILEGIFRHDRIVGGNSLEASLIGVGPANSYNFTFDPIEASILGGGNIYTIACTTGTAVNVIVDAFAGVISATPFIEVSILSSKPLLLDKGDVAGQPVGATRQALFDYLKTFAIGSPLMLTPRTNLTLHLRLNVPVLGFITDTSVINRINYFRLLGGVAADPYYAIERSGAAFINIHSVTGAIDNVIMIQQT